MPTMRFEITQAEQHFRIPVELAPGDLVEIETDDRAPREKQIYRVTDTRGIVGFMYGHDWLRDLNRESIKVHGRVVTITKHILRDEAG